MLKDTITNIISLSDIEPSCTVCVDKSRPVTHAHINEDNVIVPHCYDCAISQDFKNIFSVKSIDFNCSEICDYDGCDGDFITTHAALKRDMRLMILCEAILYSGQSGEDYLKGIPIAINCYEYDYNKNHPRD